MDLLTTILTYLVPFALGFVPVAFYATRLFNVLKEVAGLIGTISIMLDDGKVTKEEIDAVVKEAKDIIEAVKAFKDKK